MAPRPPNGHYMLRAAYCVLRAGTTYHGPRTTDPIPELPHKRLSAVCGFFMLVTSSRGGLGSWTMYSSAIRKSRFSGYNALSFQWKLKTCSVALGAMRSSKADKSRAIGTVRGNGALRLVDDAARLAKSYSHTPMPLSNGPIVLESCGIRDALFSGILTQRFCAVIQALATETSPVVTPVSVSAPMFLGNSAISFNQGR